MRRLFKNIFHETAITESGPQHVVPLSTILEIPPAIPASHCGSRCKKVRIPTDLIFY